MKQCSDRLGDPVGLRIGDEHRPGKGHSSEQGPPRPSRVPSFVRLRDQLKEIASRLEEKRAIPMVNEQLELILDLQQDEYWADITLPMLEDARKRLRELVKFIDRQQRRLIYTDFEDELGEITAIEFGGIGSCRRRIHFGGSTP